MGLLAPFYWLCLHPQPLLELCSPVGYGPYFHGRLTANGEVYDQWGLTAAHKTLPFGTRLRVCYQGCVNVRINDRGPFIGPRELDLSRGAAEAIGLIAPGVAEVKVTYL